MTESLFDKYTKLMEVLYQYQIHDGVQFKDFNDLDDEMKLKATLIINRIQEVDQVIISNLTNYTIDRLNKVDLAIIRISVFELLAKELPGEVIINLAIELTKLYADLDDEKQHKFTNRLLDNIYKNLK